MRPNITPKTLGQHQRLFMYYCGKLINHLHMLGYEATWGEALRPPITAAAYAKSGIGIKNSLHCEKLAIDINLFRNGRYLQSTAAHAGLGAWWKKQHPLLRWGGDFKKKDGNHYSITYKGRA